MAPDLITTYTDGTSPDYLVLLLPRLVSCLGDRGDVPGGTISSSYHQYTQNEAFLNVEDLILPDSGRHEIEKIHRRIMVHLKFH